MCALPQPSEFRYYKNTLHEAVKGVCMESMGDAVQETMAMNDNSNDITAIFDGTWQRRGHLSQWCCHCNNWINGKVFVYRIQSKYCRCKERLKIYILRHVLPTIL